MRKSGIPSMLAASTIGLVLSIPVPAYARPSPGPMITRDAATLSTTGDINPPPGVAILIGAQGSSNTGFRVRPVIDCDQFVSEDVTGPGAFGLTSTPGKNLYICSYSISNGSALQDVQFISGKDTSLGAGRVCAPGPAITARFHLLSNQFVSQGSGIGSLFSVPNHALCIEVTGSGHVSVNVTYASF